MKALLFLALLLISASLAAFADESPSTRLPVETGEISAIEFDSATGGLSFAVAGRRYILPGRSSAGGLVDASVAANLAVLNELRRADKVTLLVSDSADRQKRAFLNGISFS